jgi:RNA polymerase sigma-70 factor (ECF subfamily)
VSPDVFQAHRSRLFGIAYRMLGTRADAEDVVQDAWLKWAAADHAAIQTPEAWLVTVTTRLAIDRLRTAQAERQHYVGWWLPEPLVASPEEADAHTPESLLSHAHEVSLAFLWMLERLSPEERAAFLMREVFEHDYEDIAEILGKTQAACRQLVSRASGKVRDGKPRAVVQPDTHWHLLTRFMEAARLGDRAAMQALFAPDVTARGDGGGKVPSIAKLLQGSSRIACLYYAMFRRLGDAVTYRPGLVNGEPGILRYVSGQLESVQYFEIEGARIVSIYTVRNPDKLALVPAPLRQISTQVA